MRPDVSHFLWKHADRRRLEDDEGAVHVGNELEAGQDRRDKRDGHRGFSRRRHFKGGPDVSVRGSLVMVLVSRRAVMVIAFGEFVNVQQGRAAGEPGHQTDEQDCREAPHPASVRERISSSQLASAIAAANPGSARSTMASLAVSEILKYPGISKMCPGPTKTLWRASRLVNARSSASGERTIM